MPEVLYDALPLLLLGAMGGGAVFLWGLKSGRFRRGRLIQKALLELAGGMFVAPPMAMLLSMPFADSRIALIFAFLCGVGWAEIMQVIRQKITQIVESALNQFNQGGGGGRGR